MRSVLCFQQHRCQHRCQTGDATSWAMRQTSWPYTGHLSERNSLKRFQAASLILVPRFIFSSRVLEAFYRVAAWDSHVADHLWSDMETITEICLCKHTEYLSVYFLTHPHTHAHTHSRTSVIGSLLQSNTKNLPLIWVCSVVGMYNKVKLWALILFTSGKKNNDHR